jgi:hypothetical protein
MRSSIRGLAEQQRIRRVGSIYQQDQRSAEGFDAGGQGSLLGKLQARGGSHSVSRVAAAASGLFENGVNRPRKRIRIGGACPDSAHCENTDQPDHF